jgi:predicted acetyltransferase
MSIITKEEKITELKKVWKTCFEDLDEYIELVFESFYKEEYLLFKEIDEKIAASLYLFPFTLRYLGKEEKVAYLCGACTLPEFRNRGEMGKLINSALKKLYDDGIPFCALIPSSEKLFDYYGRFGFSTIYKAKTVKVNGNFRESNIGFEEINNATMLSELYAKTIGKKEFAIKKTKEYFEFLLKDYDIMKSAKVFSVLKDKKIVGYFFCEINQNRVLIREVALHDLDNEEFFSALKANFNKEIIVYMLLEENGVNGETVKMGMLRIINLTYVLSKWAKVNPQEKMLVAVKDDIISENNGTYKIENGLLSKTNQKADLELDISQIPNLLMKDEPFLNLMIN